ncbi:single-stranded DNA-binding protein [Clostridium sp. CAG:448]|nr:single-stranded DNA-binding protein [Clostridium sp. CAG:448]
MANFNLNKIILGGRLTQDPELKQTQSGIAVATFKIAVNRRYSRDNQQQEADFFNCIAWRSQAEFVSRYFHKGSAICVIGAVQNRSWTDQQNVKRYITEVVVDEVQFVDSRGDAPAGQAPAPGADAYGAPVYSSPAASAPKFEEIKTDDDLPF